MRILRARPEQAAELSSLALAAKAHWGYPEHWMQIWAPLLTITPETIARDEVWTMQSGTEIVAFYSLSARDPQVSLENMWVLPRYIGQGLGRRLFTHALSRCRKLGIQRLKIEADPYAQGFYEHMGAHKIGEHVSLLDGRPRVLPVLEMELE